MGRSERKKVVGLRNALLALKIDFDLATLDSYTEEDVPARAATRISIATQLERAGLFPDQVASIVLRVQGLTLKEVGRHAGQRVVTGEGARLRIQAGLHILARSRQNQQIK